MYVGTQDCIEPECNFMKLYCKCIFLTTDLRRLNTMAVKAANTGMIIIGGGVIKHHICNANLMVRYGSLCIHH
jgi:deoxyhypusine synthase